MKTQPCSLLIALFLIALFSGCTKTPSSTDVDTYLTTEIGKGGIYKITTQKVEVTKTDGELSTISFKATASLEKPLYTSVDLNGELVKKGWVEKEFREAQREAQKLPDEVIKQLSVSHEKAVRIYTLLKETRKAGETKEIYGTLKGKYLVDKWLLSEPKIETPIDASGETKEKFTAPTLVAESPEAMQTLEELPKLRKNFVEAVALAKQQVERESSEKQARIAAEQQRDELAARASKAEASSQKLAKRLPIQILGRKASLGQSGVLVLRGLSPERLTVKVEISDGSTSREFREDLTAGVVREIGWMQGWKFKTGDRIRISHERFDTFEFTWR